MLSRQPSLILFSLDDGAFFLACHSRKYCGFLSSPRLLLPSRGWSLTSHSRRGCQSHFAITWRARAKQRGRLRIHCSWCRGCPYSSVSSQVGSGCGGFGLPGDRYIFALGLRVWSSRRSAGLSFLSLRQLCSWRYLHLLRGSQSG